MDINSAVGRKAGLSDEKLLALVRSPRVTEGFGSPHQSTESGFTESATRNPEMKILNDLTVFNDKELLAIELADAMADTPANVSEDLYARLRNLFSEEQLLELGAHIAFENYRARLNRVFDVESDELYSPLPVLDRTGRQK